MGIIQRLRSLSVKSDRRTAGLYCVECGSKYIRNIGRGTHPSRTVFGCDRCGCIFEIDTDEDYIGDYGGLEFVDGITIERHGNVSGLDAVRRYSVRDCPDIADIAYDPQAFGFYEDYQKFVQCTEHGNAPDMAEIAKGGYFTGDMLDIKSGYAPGIHEYLDGCGGEDAKRLRSRLVGIEKKYAARSS